MNLLELRKWGRQILSPLGYENDADELLMYAIGLDKNAIVMKPNFLINSVQRDYFMKLVHDRQNHMPLQYILGKWEFMSLEFEISPDVLIPRGDTEVLVEAILSVEKNGAKGLEIGVGSGCISISLIRHGGLDMVGVDICQKAVDIANRNFERLVGVDPVSDPVTAGVFIQSDLFENVPRGAKFDFIVSNPPYISSKDMLGLDKSVKDYEPHKALHGGDDGLDFYRKIVAQAGDYLVPQGRIYFEIGYNQALDVENILQDGSFFDINIIKDLAGHDRVVHAIMR